MSHISEIIKDLPKDVQDAIKQSYITVSNKGLATGALVISEKILKILRSEQNPAKAKAKAIQFITKNRELKKKENE